MYGEGVSAIFFVQKNPKAEKVTLPDIKLK